MQKDNTSGAGAPPFDPAVLLALAERIERGEPSREWDHAIMWALRPNMTGEEAPPAYTTSLDAAVTLVPEGWHLHSASMKYGNAYVCLHRAFGSHDADEVVWRKGHHWPAEHMTSVRAKTLPAAFCAAALRARAAMVKP